MKRIAGIVVALVLGMGIATQPVQAAEMVGQQDTVIDRIGDWFATLGKSGMEKDAILTQRKADRLTKRAEQRAREGAKKAERELNQAGKDLQKSLGD